MAAMIFITKIHFSRKSHFQAQMSVRCRSDPIKQLILKDCKLRRVFFPSFLLYTLIHFWTSKNRRSAFCYYWGLGTELLL